MAPARAAEIGQVFGAVAGRGALEGVRVRRLAAVRLAPGRIPIVQRDRDGIRLAAARVPEPELDASVDALVGHLIAGGPEALAKIKDLIRFVSAGPVDDAMAKDTARRIAEIRVSPEGREGITAFLEKRKPAWTQGKDA